MDDLRQWVVKKPDRKLYLRRLSLGHYRFVEDVRAATRFQTKSKARGCALSHEQVVQYEGELVFGW